MFSKKVTYSIIILNELCSFLVDALVVKWVKIRQLASLRNVINQEVVSILSPLRRYQFVDHEGDMAILTCNSDEVTLCRLITTLHGGLPIGEETEQAITN